MAVSSLNAGFVMAIIEPTVGKAMMQGLRKLMSGNTGPHLLRQ